MKRFVVFLYERDRVSGGMYDFPADFDTLEEAVSTYRTHYQFRFDVYDLWERKYVFEGQETALKSAAPTW
jgi:hypothetical protein